MFKLSEKITTSFAYPDVHEDVLGPGLAVLDDQEVTRSCPECPSDGCPHWPWPGGWCPRPPGGGGWSPAAQPPGRPHRAGPRLKHDIDITELDGRALTNWDDVETLGLKTQLVCLLRHLHLGRRKDINQWK